MSKKGKLGFLSRIIAIVQIPVIIGFLLSALAWYFNPSNAGWIGVFGLAFPVFLMLQLFFTLYWLLRLKRPLLGSLIVLAVGWGHYGGLFQWSAKKTGDGTGALRVLTYNVHGWNSQAEGVQAETGRAGMFEIIEGSGANVVFLQEHDKDFRARWDHLPNRHIETMFEQGSIGLGIWTSLEIIDRGRLDYSVQRGGYRAFIWADVLFQGDTLRLINAQLVNTEISPESYRSLQVISEETLPSGEQIEAESKDMFRRLSDSYKIRGSQFDDLLSFVDASPHRVILGGDLNDTPDSYGCRQLKKRLKDTFIESGSGTGNTFVKVKLMPLRIDHLYVDRGFEVYNHRVVDVAWSDHLPVVADLFLADTSVVVRVP